jgi:competence ComEA-like helix-hairpin-helix protein
MKMIGALMLAACFLAVSAPTRVAGQHEETRNDKETKAPALDINQASAEEFAQLPGIGPKLARRIIAYRKRHGPFRRTEDLIAIHGMGVKKWRAIRARLKVERKVEQSEARK